MLTDLDHIVLICPDLDQGIDTYETLLGRSADWRAVDDGIGAGTAVFTVNGTALELFAPTGPGVVGDRLNQMLVKFGPRLTSLAYRTDDIEETHRLFGRRGLAPGDIGEGRSTDTRTGAERRWKRFRCPDDKCAGIKSFILEYETPLPVIAQAGPASVSGIDHVVVQTPNPDRATAIYGTRKGIRLALDRTFESWKTRLMFFELGGLTIEVAHRFDPAPDPSADDSLWGISWIVPDLAAAHERLSDAGVEVSEMRTGRRPATRVFTVKSGTLGVATLFIEILSD
ncbi:MAG: VOC family protein [Pseudomonadota bacterium]